MELRLKCLTDYHMFQWPSLLLLQWSLSFTDWWCILGQCQWYRKDTPTLRLWLKAVVSSAGCIFTLHYPMVWCWILGQCLSYLKVMPTLLLWLKAVVSSACCIFTLHFSLVLYFRSVPVIPKGHAHIAFMMENSGKQCMAALLGLPIISYFHIFLTCHGWYMYFACFLVYHCVL